MRTHKNKYSTGRIQTADGFVSHSKRANVGHKIYHNYTVANTRIMMKSAKLLCLHSPLHTAANVYIMLQDFKPSRQINTPAYYGEYGVISKFNKNSVFWRPALSPASKDGDKLNLHKIDSSFFGETSRYVK
jgi:hypothetical protein